MNKKKSLNIVEINSGTTLSVVANYNGKKLDLQAEYALVSEKEIAELKEAFGAHIVPVEEITLEQGGKSYTVSFDGHISHIQLVAVNRDGAFLWENVRVARTKLPSGHKIHVLILLNPDGQAFNRRRGVRINLDRNMEVQQDGQSYKVLVRDISYCGVGFYEALGTNLTVGEPFTLLLSEENRDGETILGKITGKILNQREAESGGVITGCVINAQHAEFLQKYIALKQIERISGKKQDMTLQKTVAGDNWKEKIVDALEASIDEKK